VLPVADAVAFEEHHLGCPECADAVMAFAEYVQAMRTATQARSGEVEDRCS
jgi:hypothetical protein